MINISNDILASIEEVIDSFINNLQLIFIINIIVHFNDFATIKQ